MIKAISAFFTTLKLMLSGENVTVAHPKLWKWIETGQPLIAVVIKSANESDMDAEVRKGIQIKVDGRDTSMEVALGGIHYHLHEDYPHVLRDYTAYSVTAIYANNMNDQYALDKLSAHEAIQANQAVLTAITRLKEHLNNIPPSNDV